MQISGKVILFVEEKKGKENKPFKTFSTTISNKNADGSYLNKSLEVRFNTENIKQESLNQLRSDRCYTLEVEDGWLSVRSYVNEAEEERKVFYLYIDKATIKSFKEIAKTTNQSNDLPF